MRRLFVLLVCFIGLALMTQGCEETQITPNSATASSEASEYGARPAANTIDGNLATNWSPLLADCTSSDGSWLELGFDEAYSFGRMVLHVNLDNGVTQLPRAGSYTIKDSADATLATGSYTATDTSKEITLTKSSTNKLKIIFAAVADVPADPTGIACPHVNEVETFKAKILGIF